MQTISAEAIRLVVSTSFGGNDLNCDLARFEEIHLTARVLKSCRKKAQGKTA
jgi:hypothetical protein